MLKSILPKLTLQEQKWLLKQIKMPKRRGVSKTIQDLDEQCRVFWEISRALDAVGWKDRRGNIRRGIPKEVLGVPAKEFDVSNKTIQRLLDDEIKRREAIQPSIDRLRKRLRERRQRTD